MPFSATRDLWLILKARDEGSRALNGFARDIRHVGDSVRMANLMAARSQLMNQQSMNRLTGATQAQMIATQARIMQVDREISGMKNMRAQQEEQRVSAQRLGSALAGVSGTLTAMGTVMTATGVIGTMAMKGLVDTAIEYQRQSALTRTQVDKFATSLKDIQDIGLRVARTIGVPFEQIQPALFDIFSSMEVGAKDAEILLTLFSKAAVAGQTDIQKSALATIGILNAFQLPVSEANHLLDLQFQLVQEGIGTYEEWAQRIGLVTPSAVRAGQSVEMMMAALAVSTRMGISAARSGTSVARAFDAMSHPRAIKGMKALGVSALDANGNFRPLIDVLGEFRAALAKLPEAERTGALLEVFKGAGGTIEARRFLQNMLLTPGNLELFKTIFDEMANESGSFEKAYSTMADTAATKSQLMSNQWQALKVAAGEALIPTFLQITSALSKVFEWFNNLTPEQQTFIIKTIAIGVALTGVLGVILLVVGGVAAIAAAFAIAGTAIAVTLGILAGGILIIGGIAAAIYNLWQNSETFRRTIRDVGQQFKTFYEEHVLPAARGIKAAWDEHMKPAFEKLNEVLQNKIMPVWRELTVYINAEFLSRVREVGTVIKDFLVRAFEVVGKMIQTFVVPAIERLTKFYYEHEETIRSVIGYIGTLLAWFGKIVAFIVGPFFIGLAVILFGALMLAIDGFTFIADKIATFIEWIKKSIEWVKELGRKFGEHFNLHTLYNIGKSLIDGLINGIKDSFQWVKRTIEDLGGNVLGWAKKALGIGSPSKEFAKIGKDSVAGYIKGLQDASPTLNARVTATTAGLTNAASVGANSGGTRNFNQNITVNTQELNPRRQAAELGWLLNGSGV